MPDLLTTETETAALARLSAKLASALRTIIQSSALAGLGPIEVARALEIDKTLASRLLTALRAEDSLTALSALPGTAPLRHFIRAVRDKGADAKSINAAERALQRFELSLQSTFGNRTRLDAALSDALPDLRRRQQETARQSVFRGVSLIRGMSIDLASITWIVYPSLEQPGRIDTRFLAAFLGIRRLRASARIRLAGKHASAARGEGLLRELCRPGDLAISMSQGHGEAVYDISTPSIRQDDDVDVFLTEFIPGAPASPGSDGALHIYGDGVDHPYKRFVLSILIHNQVWPGCDFSLHAYDIATRGILLPPTPASEAFRLPLDAEVTRAPVVNDESLGAIPIFGYGGILRSLCGPVDLSQFRMFTCDLVYPMYSSQIAMVYQRPA